MQRGEILFGKERHEDQLFRLKHKQICSCGDPNCNLLGERKLCGHLKTEPCICSKTDKEKFILVNIIKERLPCWLIWQREKTKHIFGFIIKHEFEPAYITKEDMEKIATAILDKGFTLSCQREEDRKPVLNNAQK